LKLKPEHKLLTLDIKDLYVKIPINSTLKIANKLLIINRVEEQKRKEINLILKMIINQNYLQYNGRFYKPAMGVAMGSPLSGTFTEIFLQELEQNRLKHLLEEKKFIYYNRYVDDIFIIYDQHILEQFNAQHSELQFTLNEEVNNQIEYLDLKLTNKEGQLEMEVHRKPTTDVTINNDSSHPREHKMAA
jgi:hypothetical protein